MTILKELLALEAGRVFQVGKSKGKKGAPDEPARAFDGPKGKNRSVLDKMYGEREKYFGTGDMEQFDQDDEIASFGQKPSFGILVMSGGEHRKDYYGINVLFFRNGDIEGATYDDRAEKEWKKDKSKIIAAAKKEGGKRLQGYLNPLGGMIDDDDPASKELVAKLAARKKKKLKEGILTEGEDDVTINFDEKGMGLLGDFAVIEGGRGASMIAKLLGVNSRWDLTKVGKCWVAFDGDRLAFFGNERDFDPEDKETEIDDMIDDEHPEAAAIAKKLADRKAKKK